MKYDRENIFARILRREIPVQPIYENDYVLAFADISPKAPVHVLIIPKGAYVSFDDFSLNASATEIVEMTRAVGKVARDMGLQESGYRLLSNVGPDSGQEVPHYHVHLCGGAPLGPLLAK
ncbi:adenosine 5'-monophosphoramidase [Neoasaia chiangmaiensis NBRC 101099]|uniref:Histidine triad nucleotide-binding protein n=1 Tax=Neoasaia chiangmaiensis TaxID=320497 RepID=A0A1U9KM88_9PROT|nr:histidine triad nucleotide-binding protein [Neoasaia chiangmaiensis]AQS86903.1 histidine triad nucleotide-binding protein [Neoasaia chiangmaiensis]GBR37537.1 adenosine 5'-monophosphoramidase [Neoasaia chiangmaiensis NBRC 101099]GEN15000.1 histidine triad nucleotide-binding protein [Neoasaia chiangmaiensis]